MFHEHYIYIYLLNKYNILWVHHINLIVKSFFFNNMSLLSFLFKIIIIIIILKSKQNMKKIEMNWIEIELNCQGHSKT